MSRHSQPHFNPLRILAHTLAPYLVKKMLNILSTSNVIEILRLFAACELQNELLPLLKRFCVLLDTDKVSANELSYAIHAIVKIPQTPSDALVFFFHHLIRLWKLEEITEANLNFSVRYLHPLHCLLRTDFSLWETVYIAVLNEIRNKLPFNAKDGDYPELVEGRTNLINYEDAVTVLYDIAERQHTVPSHPTVYFFAMVALRYVKKLSLPYLEKLISSYGKLLLNNANFFSPSMEMASTHLCPEILKNATFLGRKATAYALFLFGSWKESKVEDPRCDKLIQQWFQLSPTYSASLLAISIFGIGLIQPKLGEKEEESLPSICDKRMLNHLTPYEMGLFIMGFNALRLENTDPYVFCMDRAISLAPFSSAHEVAYMIQNLAACGFVSTKLNVRGLRRMIETFEETPFETKVRAIRILYEVIQSERVFYGRTLHRLQLLLRNEVINQVYKASAYVCLDLLNLCGALWNYDDALCRTLCQRISEQQHLFIPLLQHDGKSSLPHVEEYPLLTHEEKMSSMPDITAEAFSTLFLYAPRYSLMERHAAFRLYHAYRELEPSMLYRIMACCISLFSVNSTKTISSEELYVEVYEKARWGLLDALCAPREELSPKSHRTRIPTWVCTQRIMRAMCEKSFCDDYFLRTFFHYGERMFRLFSVKELLELASMVSELGLFRQLQFRFLTRKIRKKGEQIAEEFSPCDIRAFLHILWHNKVQNLSSLTWTLGQRATEFARKGF